MRSLTNALSLPRAAYEHFNGIGRKRKRTNSMAKRKKRRTSASKKKSTAFFELLKNERFHFILGVIVAFIGIFMLLAIISFLFTGAADQSNVLNRSFWELVRSETPEIRNWTGAGGAYIAERLVNEGFGIASAFVPLFLIYLGLRIMRVSKFSFLKAFFISAFGLIGISITSAFILDKILPDTHVKWGGAHGIQIEQFLEGSIGWPGIVLLILLFAVIVAVIFRKSSMHDIQQTLFNSKPSFATADDFSASSSKDTADPHINQKEKKPGFIYRLTALFQKRIFDEEDTNEDAGTSFPP